MMGKMKLSEIKAQIASISAHPGGQPSQSAATKNGSNRIVRDLESLCAALESAVKKRKRSKARRRPAKR
jgi:hypothetical protein